MIKNNSQSNISNQDALETLFQEIEQEVANAYEIGYFHAKGKRSDDGWGIHFENIKQNVLKHIKTYK